MKQAILVAMFFLHSFLSFGQNAKATALLNEGVALHDQGKYTEAIDKYKASYQLDSNNVALYSEMAMTYSALKDFENAGTICEKAIARFPGSPTLKMIYSNYGNSLVERQKPEEAIKIFDEAIRKYPDYYMLPFNKGITEYHLKKPYAARACFEDAIKLNPKHASSWYYLGVVEDAFGNRIPAVLDFSRFLILEPKGPRADQILPFLTRKVNGLYYLEKKGEETFTYNSAAKRTDTSANGFVEAESGLKAYVELSATPSLSNRTQTELDKFEALSSVIFESLEECRKSNQGFYGDFLIPYFIELDQKQHTRAFTYFINHYETKNQDVANWPDKNEPAMNAFIAWDKNYHW